MSIPPYLSRPIGLLVGVVMVSGASVLVPSPVMRTILVWLGFVPIVWALQWIYVRRGAQEVAARPAPAPQPPKPGGAPAPKATATPARPAAPERPGRPAAAPPPPTARPAAGAAAAPASRPGAGPASAPVASPGAAPTPTAKPGEGPPQAREFLGLRRLTEQYLKEVRRMNLVATWGREGTIPRQQALDEIRQIEERMRNLTERMKFVAGKPEE